MDLSILWVAFGNQKGNYTKKRQGGGGKWQRCEGLHWELHTESGGKPNHNSFHMYIYTYIYHSIDVKLKHTEVNTLTPYWWGDERSVEHRSAPVCLWLLSVPLNTVYSEIRSTRYNTANWTSHRFIRVVNNKKCFWFRRHLFPLLSLFFLWMYFYFLKVFVCNHLSSSPLYRPEFYKNVLFRMIPTWFQYSFS